MRLCLGTVSNALLMSMAMSMVLWDGFLFRPFIMFWDIVVRAVVVEWDFLNPC